MPHTWMSHVTYTHEWVTSHTHTGSSVFLGALALPPVRLQRLQKSSKVSKVSKVYRLKSLMGGSAKNLKSLKSRLCCKSPRATARKTQKCYRVLPYVAVCCSVWQYITVCHFTCHCVPRATARKTQKSALTLIRHIYFILKSSAVWVEKRVWVLKKDIFKSRL